MRLEEKEIFGELNKVLKLGEIREDQKINFRQRLLKLNKIGKEEQGFESVIKGLIDPLKVFELKKEVLDYYEKILEKITHLNKVLPMVENESGREILKKGVSGIIIVNFLKKYLERTEINESKEKLVLPFSLEEIKKYEEKDILNLSQVKKFNKEEKLTVDRKKIKKSIEDGQLSLEEAYIFFLRIPIHNYWLDLKKYDIKIYEFLEKIITDIGKPRVESEALNLMFKIFSKFIPEEDAIKLKDYLNVEKILNIKNIIENIQSLKLNIDEEKLKLDLVQSELMIIHEKFNRIKKNYNILEHKKLFVKIKHYQKDENKYRKNYYYYFIIDSQKFIEKRLKDKENKELRKFSGKLKLIFDLDKDLFLFQGEECSYIDYLNNYLNKFRDKVPLNLINLELVRDFVNEKDVEMLKKEIFKLNLFNNK